MKPGTRDRVEESRPLVPGAVHERTRIAHAHQFRRVRLQSRVQAVPLRLRFDPLRLIVGCEDRGPVVAARLHRLLCVAGCRSLDPSESRGPANAVASDRGSVLIDLALFISHRPGHEHEARSKGIGPGESNDFLKRTTGTTVILGNGIFDRVKSASARRSPRTGGIQTQHPLYQRIDVAARC